MESIGEAAARLLGRLEAQRKTVSGTESPEQIQSGPGFEAYQQSPDFHEAGERRPASDADSFPCMFTGAGGGPDTARRKFRLVFGGASPAASPRAVNRNDPPGSGATAQVRRLE